MAPQAVGGLRRADARANHAAMLRAAATLIGERDVDLPYDEIALAAGVGRATVYRHFPTHTALSRALLADALDRWDEVVAGLPAGAERFGALFDAWVRRQQDRAEGVDLLAGSAPDEDLGRARRRFEATLREPTRLAQRAGIVDDRLSARDVRVILMMLSTAHRSSSPPGDRRRAIRFARELLFTARSGSAVTPA